MSRYKIALVTGASKGIGKEIAKLLVHKGYFVLLNSRKREDLEKVRGEIGNRTLSVPADITKKEEVKKLIKKAVRITGRIDALVNNAGVAKIGKLEKFSLKDFEETMRTNVTGVFLVTKESLRFMKRGSVIINIGSIASKKGFPEWGAYCASKFALLGMTKVWREELRKRGIFMSIILPGSVNTPLWNKTNVDRKLRKFMLSPQEVAKSAVYILENVQRNTSVEEISILPGQGIL